MRTNLLLVLRAALLFAVSVPATAQCTTGWLLPSIGFGVTGAVDTIGTWDPDGSGPQSPLVVLGGLFGQAGTLAASNVAFYDPATQAFSVPPAGPNGRVLAVAGMSNGDLIVGGEFTQVGTTTGTGGIARWDGNTWHSLSGGVGGTVRALLEDQSGDLVVAGTFQTVGGSLTVNHVVRWNGTSWSAYGQGVQQPVNPLLPAGVLSMVESQNGDLLVGGNFALAGAVAAHTIARWNGSQWLASDAGLTLWTRTRQLFQHANGTLYAVGDVLSPLPNSGVVEWNGTSWMAPSGFPNDVGLLSETASGKLLAAVSGPRIDELQATGWATIATSAGGSFRAIAPLPGQGADDVIVGGVFATISGQPATNLAMRLGSSWLSSSSGPDALIYAFASAPDGTLYVGGQFTMIDGVPLSRIAAWNGASWQALGSGVDNRVQSIAVAPNGDVYAAGDFQNAGGVAASRLARWDGAMWHAVPGAPSWAAVVRFLRDGRLLVAGQGVSIHDGTSWQTILSSPAILDVVELPDGRVAATGGVSNWNNPSAGTSRTAIWNGTTWQPLPYAHSVANALTVAPNGDLVVAASFFSGERIGRWDGASWQPLGAGLDVVPHTLTSLPNGQVVAGGPFLTSGSAPTPYLARFDGVNWLPLGAGSAVFRAHFAPTGRLHAATNLPTPQLLQLVTSCPASSIALTSGCTGGNPIGLQATGWPYVGGRYRAFATGVPNNALVLDVFGVSTNPVLVSSVLATATPGCTLLPATDLHVLRFPGGGVLQSELTLPSSPWLTGIMLWHQMLSLQLDAQGNIVGAATSNPLELTIGSY